MTTQKLHDLKVIAVCLLSAGLLAGCQPQASSTSAGENGAVAEDLSKRLPGQGHAMTDVEYHYSNLWFAGRAENWPLAEFYLHETEEGMEWSVDIRPVRQDNAGRDVNLEEIFQSIENSTLPPLREAIANGDSAAFETHYRNLMEACHQCHVAADKPFLRPTIPEHPPAAGMDFAPIPPAENAADE